MRRPKNFRLVCSLAVFAGLGLSGEAASAQAPQPPASGAQQSTFVIDSDQIGAVLTPSQSTTSAPTTTVKAKAKTTRKARTASTPTTLSVRILDPDTAPPTSPAAAPSATPARAGDGAIPESVWAALRKCESGGNYAINTGNGYYGAYQFAAGTWRKLGFSGLPHEASPATQDEAARKLQSQQGWGPWPACTRKLGLR